MQSDYFSSAIEATAAAASAAQQAGVTRPRPPSPADLSPRKAVKRDSGTPPRASIDADGDVKDPANGGAGGSDKGSNNGGAAASSTGGSGDGAPAGASGSVPSGPPFICPTCATSYSRLEYLRRHERRHADIRPFVCDCGKGFSRSDVLSRHKRQCKIVLQIEGGGEGDASATADAGSPPKPPKARRSSAAKPGRPKGSTKAAKAAASGSNAGDGPAPPPPAPDGDDIKAEALDQQRSTDQSPPTQPGQSGQQPSQQEQQHQQQQVGQNDQSQTGRPDDAKTSAQPESDQQPEDASAMIDPAIAADSHASSSASAVSGTAAAYSYAPGVDSSTTELAMSRLPLYSSAYGHAPMHSQVSALSHQYYQPSSPESSASRSEHGSPRYASQGLVRHGSNPGSRFGLRGSAYEYSNARGLPGGSLSSTDAAIWEGLDTAKLPSPGNVGAAAAQAARAGSSVFAGLGPGFPVTSPLSHLSDRTRAGTHLGSDGSYFRAGGGTGVGGLGAYPSASASSSGFSYPTPSSSSVTEASPASNNAASHPTAPSSLSQGQTDASGATTPKEPIRFSVSTMGPLSPFSNTALNSSMSPYLSAFSNARDTPHVSSPRGGLPGTPGGTLDIGSSQWNNMRPPSRTVSRHNSIHGLATSSTTTSPQSDGGGGSQGAKVGKSASTDKLNVTESSTRSTLASSSAPDLTSSALAAIAAAAASAAEAMSKVPSTTAERRASGGSNGSGGKANGGTSSAPSSRSAAAPSSAAPVNEASRDNSASTTAAAATDSTVAVNNATSGMDTPSRFVKDQSEQYFDGGALTPGPEAFLLRIQGGAQELRAGINSMLDTTAVFGPSSITGSLPLGGANFAGSPLWDAAIFGNAGLGAPSNGLPSSTPMSASNSALGWLMSPSIQQLLQAFPPTGSALSSHKDKTDYFSVSAPSSTELERSLEAEVAPSPLELALTDVKNPFYLPPQFFRPCYSIPHWNLPPIARLSMIALHAQQNLLKHFPVIHEPTFRLDTTPACLAFAICMLGSHEAGRKWWAGEEVVPKTAMHVLNSLTQPPDTSRASQRQDDGPSKYFDEEDGRELVKPIVMTEKMDMLMRTFASRCGSARDKCSVIQSLMLFQSNNFLSSDASTRTVAAISHGSVVALARQAGLFDPDAEHVRRDVHYTAQEVLSQFEDELAVCRYSHSMLPNFLPACPDDDKVWRKWCELEGRRRTAFVIFTVDTVASLDAGIPTLLRIDELEHLPLPSPDALWRAPTCGAWQKALNAYQGPTLDEALQQLLGAELKSPPPGESASSTSIFGKHGPFSRLVTIVALLRGIIGMLEGRAQKVPRPCQLDKWMSSSRASSPDKTAAEVQISCYKKALSRWRKSWDADETCKPASSPTAVASAVASTGQQESFSSEMLFTPLTASGATALCDDALPLYWLSHVLVTHAASDQKLPLRSGSSIREATGGTAAANGGIDMPDFRSMLRFAKNFVTRGEK